MHAEAQSLSAGHRRQPQPLPMRKREGFPLRNCRCRPIPSSRDRAPGSDFARGYRLATARKAAPRPIARPLTRLLLISTFKHTGTRMSYKL